MKNIKKLRDELCSVFEDLKTNSIDVKNASEMNNAAGKIINTVKIQLDYAAQRKEKPNISFLDY